MSALLQEEEESRAYSLRMAGDLVDSELSRDEGRDHYPLRRLLRASRTLSQNIFQEPSRYDVLLPRVGFSSPFQSPPSNIGIPLHHFLIPLFRILPRNPLMPLDHRLLRLLHLRVISVDPWETRTSKLFECVLSFFIFFFFVNWEGLLVALFFTITRVFFFRAFFACVCVCVCESE